MEKFELTDVCGNDFCGARLPEPLLAPAFCEDCEDDRLQDENWESQEAWYTAMEILDA